jgi:cellulose synthase/poly-beta-1,6-N-acetylglucosamine synthase-like glycosyltransferase
MRWLLWALAGHTAVNSRLLRRTRSVPVQERVSVLVPARDEAARIEACVRSLVGQGAAEVLVLDDGSSDGTAELARAAGATVLSGAPLPQGWFGKPFACQQLADAADPASTVLVFVDADVVLEPGALGAAVDALRDLDLVSPYPRQEAPGVTRLVQPLQLWSVLTFLPLRWAERSARTSLTAATGQLLVVRRSTYDRAGGHAAVRDQVAEDLALLRNVKRAGGRGVVVDGTDLATCRMYDDWRSLRDGYGKSLHELPPAVPIALAAVYLAPLLGRHRRQAYAAMVLSRAVAARRTRTPVVDALAHPLSVALAIGLWCRSRWSREEISWKGRTVPRDRPRAARDRTPSAARSRAPRST